MNKETAAHSYNQCFDVNKFVRHIKYDFPIQHVGAKSMSPVETELLFVILYNITGLHHNTNIFFCRNHASNLKK